MVLGDRDKEESLIRLCSELKVHRLVYRGLRVDFSPYNDLLSPDKREELGKMFNDSIKKEPNAFLDNPQEFEKRVLDRVKQGYGRSAYTGKV